MAKESKTNENLCESGDSFFNCYEVLHYKYALEGQNKFNLDKQYYLKFLQETISVRIPQWQLQDRVTRHHV